MEYKNKTFKDIRINALHFSQEDMAMRMDLSLDEYVRIEDQELSLTYLMKLAQSVGMPIETLLSLKDEPIKFSINDKWSSIEGIKGGLSSFIQSEEPKINKVSDPSFRKDLLGLVTTVNKLSRKPRIAVVGKSDVGKSTLINSLLGSQSMPEAWTPTTSIIIYAKHTCDKPSYLSDDVIVFKSDNNNNIWEPSKLEDEEYTIGLSIAKGSYDLLSEYGARKNGRVLHQEATSAVVFIDSPILRNCDILDLPGYGTGDRQEDDSLLRKINGVDILIYMSIANGFFRGDDILWIQNELPNLNPLPKDIPASNRLDNLFIVASQAHTVANGSTKELSSILDRAAERFEATLPKGYWKHLGVKVTHEYFRSRFFTYSTNQECLREDFDKAIRSLLEMLPRIITDTISNTIKAHVENSMKEVDNQVRSFQGIINARDKKKTAIKEIEKGRTSGLRKIEHLKTELKKRTETSKTKRKNQFTGEFNGFLTVDHIKEIIAEKGYKNKEDDIKLLLATISNNISAKYQEIVKEFNSEYRKDLNEFFVNYDDATDFQKLNDDKYHSSFSSKRAYMKALNTLAEQDVELGANKAWAIEELPNMNMPLSGLSTIMSIVSLAGGISCWFVSVPGLNIAAIVLAIVSILIKWIVSFFWEKIVAQKIIEEYENKKVLFKYQSGFSDYCNSTSEAFSKGVGIVDEEAANIWSEIKQSIINFNESEIVGKIEAEELKKTIYSNLLSALN